MNLNIDMNYINSLKKYRNYKKEEKYLKKSQEMVNLWTNRPLALNTNF